MNVQPKLSQPDDCTMIPPEAHERRVPGGPRSFATWPARDEAWPVEFEVEPWRP
jgi:hypothetical protein